jgi:1-acyl-sn-glycerol-3-phosphate acyltransferase
VQPVALCYGDDEHMDLRVPFAPKENFLHNFLRLLGGPPLQASVHFLEPVAIAADGRRQTAEAARVRIAEALGIPAP